MLKKLSDLLDFKQDTDTRDNSILYLYTIKDRLDKDSYILLSIGIEIKKLGGR